MQPDDRNFAISLKDCELAPTNIDDVLNGIYEFLTSGGLGSTYAADIDGEGRFDICFYLNRPEQDMLKVKRFCDKFPDTWDVKIIRI
jgi:hypothetical protein